MKNGLLALVAALSLSGCLSGLNLSGPGNGIFGRGCEDECEEKVELCHVPPGNPENAHTINISVSAVDAHLDNHAGDHLGECDCFDYDDCDDEETGEETSDDTGCETEDDTGVEDTGSETEDTGVEDTGVEIPDDTAVEIDTGVEVETGDTGGEVLSREIWVQNGCQSVGAHPSLILMVFSFVLLYAFNRRNK